MVTVLRTGIPSYENDAMHALRERLSIGHSRGQRLTYSQQLWLFKKTWNMFAAKRPVRHLQLPSGNVDLDGLDLGMM